MTRLVVALLLCEWLAGCAALTNPVGRGIPVRDVPPELLAEAKQCKEPVPLFCLRSTPPPQYLLGGGDVLGVYIEGILGEANQPLPVQASESGMHPLSVGYPIPVREDGTVSLPFVPAVSVQGMTLPQAERAIIEAYTVTKHVITPGRERILVSLIRPRQTRVLVIRHDNPGGSLSVTSRGFLGTQETIGSTTRGSGMILELPAYESDVLSALAQTGGLPGPDAANEVVVQRGYMKSSSDLAPMPTEFESQDPISSTNLTSCGVETIRIPLRLPPGAPLPFRPEDTLLRTGDIVYVPSRDTEVFYTAGLLPAGEHLLPRDRDLGVVQAIAQIGGPMVNGGMNANNLSGTLTSTGIGAPSPRLVSVLRRKPDGEQITIYVDLDRALRNPHENLLVKEGDVLILQETKTQAMMRYASEVLHFGLVSQVIQTSRTTGTATWSAP
jgi:protein involved in polysaccharide export with SLBB domain